LQFPVRCVWKDALSSENPNLLVQQLAEWLRRRDRPVTEIMLEAGFSTKSNFNREFLRVQGMSLSEWRKSYAADS
jgi:AraC-like DNA-binding protein